MDEMLERFCRIFGVGSSLIKEYLRYVEDFYEGQAENGTESAAWFVENVDKEKVYGLFEKAYESEPNESLRNNIRLLRMAFRYSDLHHRVPGSDELRYMSSRFGSYWGREGQTGYGIAIFDIPGKSGYIPDKWYFVS
jgi:hypothetical protein